MAHSGTSARLFIDNMECRDGQLTYEVRGWNIDHAKSQSVQLTSNDGGCTWSSPCSCTPNDNGEVTVTMSPVVSNGPYIDQLATDDRQWTAWRNAFTPSPVIEPRSFIYIDLKTPSPSRRLKIVGAFRFES